jgi:hypothetical protein
MTDPRTPRTKEAQLPDPLDQNPAETDPALVPHGSEDAQLLAGAALEGGDVERETAIEEAALTND